MRIHRSLARQMRKVNVDKVLRDASEYLEGSRYYKKDLEEIPGLTKVERIKKMFKKVEEIEREMVKLERKLIALDEKRAFEAVRLEDELMFNLDILKDYMEPDELRDFR